MGCNNSRPEEQQGPPAASREPGSPSVVNVASDTQKENSPSPVAAAAVSAATPAATETSTSPNAEPVSPEPVPKSEPEPEQGEVAEEQLLTLVDHLFLHEFLEKHGDAISDTMTTSEVVKTIVIPATADSRLSYVEAHLLGTNRGRIQSAAKTKADGAEYAKSKKTFFVSHAWSMPFRMLVSLVDEAMVANAKEIYGLGPTLSELLETAKKSCGNLLWIDVFCKNQHIPAPAMEEFRSAITASSAVLLSYWPARNPLALTRVWCLYEIYSAAMLGARLSVSMPTDTWKEFQSIHKIKFDGDSSMSDDDVERLLRETGLEFDAKNAQASVASDKDMILGLIHSDMSIEKFHDVIWKQLASSVRVKRVGENFGSIPCFAGDGQVAMADGTTKRVDAIQAGDLVCGGTSGAPAAVTLVTRDALTEPVEACLLNGLWVTSEHPVLVDNQWVLPKSLVKPEMVPLDAVYNFELEKGGNSFVVNGVQLIALGHNLDIDPASDAIWGHGWALNPDRVRYQLAPVSVR
eukprot:m.82100 g.82100  ORF g.82100 m.82100 type:complete len:520 (+) comp8252_c0_seq1:161-1720(+)